VLRETTEKHPDDIAVVSKHQNIRLTYRELLERSEKVAASLIHLGFEKGDRVGIYSQNNIEWIVTQFATALADLILVNINPAYRANELKYALEKVGCKGLILSPIFKTSNYINILQEIAPEIPNSDGRHVKSATLPDLKVVIRLGKEKTKGYLNFDDLYENHTREDVEKLHRVENNAAPEDPINIQFTSGTTGFPKGATLCHQNILHNGLFVGRRCGYTSKDSICVTVPLYHCFGMVMANLAAVTYGAKLVYPDEGFNAYSSLKAIHEERLTSVYGVPTMFIEMLRVNDEHKGKFDLSSVRTGIIAGSVAPRPILERIINELNCKEITNAYGMTETSPVSFQTTATDSFEDRVASVGKILPHLEAKVVDPEGRIVHPGFPGELWVRGATVMLQYWGDPKNTEKSIHRGWMKTGDLATIDERGYCRIVGRVKDMIIRGGENVYPKEIEEFLLRHPEIEDVQVVGVNDEKFGEEIAALIKPKDIKNPPSKKDILAFCKDKIAHYKVPKFIKFVSSYPMTVTGKPQKNKMRDELNEDLKDKTRFEEYRIR